jgi:4-hydroxybenzoate polyprenyltransferase
MKLADALRLGRVSNLPTVWTNALAGLVLAGGWLDPAPLLLLLLAVSLAYVGGMFLNDAFDAEIDAVRRPERPIPSGAVDRGTVLLSGFALLAASILCLGLIGAWSGAGLRPAWAGLALAAAIVFYDWHHKDNPLSPVVMALCRVLVYVAAAFCATAAPPLPLWTGALLLFCHLIGLTYLAKHELRARAEDLWPTALLVAPLAYGLAIFVREPVAIVFWLALAAALFVALRAIRRRGPGDVGFAVMTLIAAISLLDALLIAGRGYFGLALLAALGFVLTLVLQRFVRGT